jgi:hypothetical protein
MSYLMPTIQPNTASYYFATDSNPDPLMVTVPALTANGAGRPGNTGIVNVLTQDTTGEGVGAYTISNSVSGAIRWGIDLDGQEDATPTGGSNFMISRYDNGGGYLNSPFYISRATGNVTINGNLTASSITAPNILSQAVYTFPAANPVVPGTNIDLVANNANNLLTIPVPLAAQNAKLFKLRITGGWEYQSGSLIAANLKMYGSATSQALAPADGDTQVLWTNVFNDQNFIFGTNSAQITALPPGGATPVVSTNEMVLTVQNPTGAAVANLYFIVLPTPADGSQAIGNVVTSGPYNLSANVEAYY